MKDVMQLGFYTVWTVVGIIAIGTMKVYYPMIKASVKFTEKMLNDLED